MSGIGARARFLDRLPGRSASGAVDAVVRIAAIPVLLIALVAPATGSGYLVSLATVLAINVILALGLNVMIGYAGLLNLGYAAFAGVAGYGAAVAMVRLQLPWGAGAVIGIALAVLLAFVMALPTLKLRKVYLAIVTLAFGELFVLLVFNFPTVTGGPVGLAAIPRPDLGVISLRDSRLYYYFALALAVVCTLFVLRFGQSRYGRMLKYVREDEQAAASVGIDTDRAKLLGFVAGAVLAAIGGILLASHLTALTHRTFAFPLTLSVFTMVVVGGTGSVAGVIAGAGLLTLVPEALRELQDLRLFLYGVALALVVLLRPAGLLPVRQRSMFRGDPEPDLARDLPFAARAGPVDGPPAPLLAIRNAGKDFQGLKALEGVDVEVADGELHSVIGPNGAGKTTLVNLVTGALPATRGEFEFAGRSIRSLGTSQRARVGLVRTFQRTRLFPDLTVLENVAAGRLMHTRSGFLSSLLGTAGQRREEEQQLRTAAACIQFVGTDLYHRRHEVARNLPYGLQKRVEIARALAAEPRLLILDEPAAGLNSAEKDSLVELIAELRRHGVTIVLIEHDMRIVMRISDRITVLDNGRKIVEGDEAAVRSNPRVVDAYLGSEV